MKVKGEKLTEEKREKRKEKLSYFEYSSENMPTNDFRKKHAVLYAFLLLNDEEQTINTIKSH